MVPLTPLTSKNYTSPIFFLVFHRWHCWRLKKYEEKYFKRDTGLIADGAVDTVDIKKLFINFFFLYFTVDVWKNMKRNISKQVLVSLLMVSLTLLTSKNWYISQFFFPLFGWWLHWCLWHLKKLQRSIELKHILSFLLIHTVQILILMFSALR